MFGLFIIMVVTTVPLSNVDSAVAQAAALAWGHLARQVADPEASAAKLAQAIVPVYGISWNRNVITSQAVGGTNEINRVLCLLRNSNLARSEYVRLAAFMKRAYSHSSLFPPEMGEWHDVAQRYRLEMHFPWGQLLATSTQLVAAGFPLPSNLAEVHVSELHSMATASPFPVVLRALWSSARMAYAPLSSAGEDLTPAHELFTQDSLVKAIRRHSAQFAHSGTIAAKSSSTIKAPKAFDKMGPARKIRYLKSSAVHPLQVNRFIKDQTQANLLKQVKGSLPGMASAFRCYTSFCELKGVRPFPVREEVVTQWSSVFNNTATYGNYVTLLERCCFFLHFPTTWKSPCIRHIAKGLAKCQDKSFRFPNFIRSPLLLRIISHETSVNGPSEFAQAAFFSFLFSFRAPSETLQLKRAYATDLLDDFSPQEDKALIGIRFSDGSPFLVAKLSWRKNLVSGCILRRPCFCSLSGSRAPLLCPVHAFWPLVKRRVEPGEFLFPAVTRRNFNCILKAALAKIHEPSADRYSSHAFRRGASQELKESGSPWTVVASSGFWRSPSFRGYVDLPRDVEVGVQKLFDIDLDSDSADEEPAHYGLRAGKPREWR